MPRPPDPLPRARRADLNAKLTMVVRQSDDLLQELVQARTAIGQVVGAPAVLRQTAVVLDAQVTRLNDS